MKTNEKYKSGTRNQTFNITCCKYTLIIGHICTRHYDPRRQRCLFLACMLCLFIFFYFGHFFEARLLFGTSGKIYIDTSRKQNESNQNENEKFHLLEVQKCIY